MRPEQLQFDYTFPPEHYTSEIELERTFRNFNRKATIPALGLSYIAGLYILEVSNNLSKALLLTAPFLLIGGLAELASGIQIHKAKKKLKLAQS